LAGGVFCLSDHFIDHWKRPDQPFIIALTYQVGACRRFWSVDSVMDREPDEHNPIADAIERPPPETTDCHERRVVDLPDDLGRL
jgi:hypothetical protein